MKETNAEKAYRKHIKGWEPTSREFDDYFKVGPTQGRNIRRTVKSLAADDGHVYGYHPALNRIVLAFSGNVSDARAIIDYSAVQAGRAVGGLRDQVRGAKRGKCVTAVSANKVDKTIISAQEGIESVAGQLSWKKVVSDD